MYFCTFHRKYKEKQERHERWCENNAKKLLHPREEPVPDPELNWTPRTDYDLYEPPLRYYEDFKAKYLHFLNKKKRENFLAKYKRVKSVEEE